MVRAVLDRGWSSVRRVSHATRKAFSLAIVGISIAALAGYWIAHLGTEVHPDADSGIIEVNVQDAVRGRMLTGPYSRFGWNHPGPSFFLLLAPLYLVTGRNPIALHLGVALINGASALALVAVVRRIEGEVVARYAAGVVALLLVGLSPVELSRIWNPNALAVPLLLFLVLVAAAGARGSWLYLLGATLVGSFVVQTHLSVAGVVAVLLVIATATVALTRARTGAPATSRSWLVIASLALGLIWALPSVESFPRFPENIQRLADFFLRREAVAVWPAGDVASAVASVVRPAASVPLGLRPFVMESSDDTARLAVVLTGVVVSLVALLLGWRRRNWFAAAMAATTLAGLLLGFIAATRPIGPRYPYLFWWCAALPIPGWLALGAVLLRSGRPGGGARAAAIGVTLGAAAASTWFVVQAVRSPIAELRGSPVAPRIVQLLLQRVPAIRREGIELTAPVPAYADYAAVYATLRRQGIDAVVAPDWSMNNFGRLHVAGIDRSPPPFVAYLVPEGQAWTPEPPGLTHATWIGTVDGLRVWVGRRATTPAARSATIARRSASPRDIHGRWPGRSTSA